MELVELAMIGCRIGKKLRDDSTPQAFHRAKAAPPPCGSALPGPAVGYSREQFLEVVKRRRLLGLPVIVCDMKLVCYANHSVLMGSDDADILIEYARLLGEYSRTDAVRMRALSVTGTEVEVSFLLNAATSLLTETAPEANGARTPDNADARMGLLDRIFTLTQDFDPSNEDSW
ncbi:hypothetical protein A0130_09900 [Leifsonia xyli]|uniref:hypothetical protein n=1 Tax=Leifsonia xyli TaxID=1575 RepID=UPI0007CDC938|nr:hypothetical protein A0130_09900 [Leifsonia xyli]